MNSPVRCVGIWLMHDLTCCCQWLAGRRNSSPPAVCIISLLHIASNPWENVSVAAAITGIYALVFVLFCCVLNVFSLLSLEISASIQITAVPFFARSHRIRRHTWCLQSIINCIHLNSMFMWIILSIASLLSVHVWRAQSSLMHENSFLGHLITTPHLDVYTFLIIYWETVLLSYGRYACADAMAMKTYW